MRKALFFLGILHDSEIEWMIAAGDKRAVMPGEALIREGASIDSLFLILKGKLTVSASASADRELARLLPGEIIGEMSFVDNRPPSATVYALEKSVVLAIPRAALLARLNTDPSFAARFYRALSVFLSDRLRHTVDQLDYSRGKGLGEATNYSDEIGHESLEAVSLAGARFDWVQRRLHAN